MKATALMYLARGSLKKQPSQCYKPASPPQSGEGQCFPMHIPIPVPAWGGRRLPVTLVCAEQLDQILQTQAALGNAMPRWHAAIQAGAYYVSAIKCYENRHRARRG